MYKVLLRKNNREKRKIRIRAKVLGTAQTPRLSVFRSLKYTYAQLIDDTKGHTLVDVSKEALAANPAKPKKSTTKRADAYASGELLAKKALELGIKKVVFDRSGYRFHGRVAKLAEGARKGGLTF